MPSMRLVPSLSSEPVQKLKAMLLGTWLKGGSHWRFRKQKEEEEKKRSKAEAVETIQAISRAPCRRPSPGQASCAPWKAVAFPCLERSQPSASSTESSGFPNLQVGMLSAKSCG